MAHYEPPHQDLRCLEIRLFSSLVVKELKTYLQQTVKIENTILVTLISSLSGETRNSVGMARLAESVRRVSGRA